MIIEDGVCKLSDRSALAGSIATMDRLIRTAVNIAGIPLNDACRMASETPARIMGIYDRGELNSAVMIRFVEQHGDGLSFKAGGGITSKSDCRKEYDEVLQKIYLPFE